jgi:hypothetical protein
MRLLVILLALLTAAPAAFAADNVRPPADNKLAAASDIREMVVNVLGKNMRVAVPAGHIPRIWAKLQPAAVDDSPANWRLMGYDLDLTLKNGSKLYVCVYDLTTSAPGAFSAGPTSKERTYYRGGNSQQVREAIATAVKEAQEAGK